MASAKQKNTQSERDNDDEKDNDSGLVDFNATDVKKVLKRAQKRGFITHDEINALLPNDEMTSDQIEDVMSQISEMGIAVVETEEEAEEQGKALTKIEDRKVVAKKGNARGSDRTDDPVRMYLREMGAVELLSREGEIAIAKRIEAGRDAMIRGLCESPLTFEAMMVWRDELINERILLRDLIDLEATYGAENPPPEPKPVEKEEEPEAKAKSRRGDVDEVEAERERQQKEAEEEEDEDDAAAMSMSAMEAELRDGVLAKLDEISDGFGRYRKLQDKLVARRMEGKELTPKAQANMTSCPTISSKT
jgi:RNA polymerase primary sigma factor